MQITMRANTKLIDTMTRTAISALFVEFVEVDGGEDINGGGDTNEELQDLASGAPQRSLFPLKIT